MSDLDRELAWARQVLSGQFDPHDGNSPPDEYDLCRALLAEHERAEANAADARRWRAVRVLPVLRDFLFGAFKLPDRVLSWFPKNVNAAADALADQQEAQP